MNLNKPGTHCWGGDIFEARGRLGQSIYDAGGGGAKQI